MATGVTKAVWNGDLSEETSQAGMNLIMRLEYEGKATKEEIVAIPPGNISMLWEEGQAIHNRLYYGDNLSVLATLSQDPAIKGKVKLIYIDPPYATNSVFQSRSQVDAYEDLLRGSHFVEFLRKRLILLRELLADDGSIYVHLDENMAFHIKVIMDEVFGSKNFRNWITRKKCNPKNYTRKTYGNVSDFILFYTKTDEYIWHRPYEDWTTERAHREYPYIDEKTGRRYKKVPVHASGVRNGATGQPWRGMNPPPGKHWQFTPVKLEEMDQRGEIYWSSTGNPRRKIYLENSQGVPVQDIWLDVRDLYNQNTKITGYPTEKNADILSRVIQASSNPGDLVLDCFAGSGTTLAVADQLNRRWIGVDNSLEAIKTILNRLTNGTEKMGDYVQHLQPLSKGGLDVPSNISLFEDSEDISSINKDEPISNFGIYGDNQNSAELEIIIQHWKQPNIRKSKR